MLRKEYEGRSDIDVVIIDKKSMRAHVATEGAIT